MEHQSQEHQNQYARDDHLLRPGDQRDPDVKRMNPPPPVPVRGLRLISLLGGPLLFALLLWLPAPEGMNDNAWRLVAMTGWMVLWWLGEAVPIAATALLPIVLMPLLNLGKTKAVASSFAHPIIFLFLGGFLIAAAMQRVGLHRRIALHIVKAVGKSANGIVLGFMLATGFLSMWISNTATSIMMFAVGISVIDFLSQRLENQEMVRRFAVALMLGIAYSASIGGVGTLIGTPPNALLASFLSDTYGVEISFMQWMKFGVPIVCIMLPIAWLMLTRVIFKTTDMPIGEARNIVQKELDKLGSMQRGEKLVALIAGLTAACWMLRKPIVQWTGLALDDTVIALLAAMLLFAIPVSPTKGKFALDWEAARNVPWGVLLLFGGGLALAAAFKSTGLAEWIGEGVGGINANTWLLILLAIITIIYLTEITSNTASTATFLPLLGAVAVGLAIDPMLMTVPVAVGASMAFMMPVATPPNAIVFSYEGLQLKDMVKAGFWLNLVAIVVTFAAMYLWGQTVFGL